MSKCILVINPGSTSTKIAVFRGEEKVFDETIRHSREELAPFRWVMEQVDFRRAAIESALSAHGFDLTALDGICARGGQLPPCASGTYLVDQAMVDYMYTVKNAAHASNLGCVLALELAQPLKIPAFICDPVSVDEMTDEARITGLPELPRTMLGHALNCRAMARRCAEEVLHRPLEECRLIVLHLGGGASARLFIGGSRRRFAAAAGAPVLLRQIYGEGYHGFHPGQGRPCGPSGHRRRPGGGKAHRRRRRPRQADL